MLGRLLVCSAVLLFGGNASASLSPTLEPLLTVEKGVEVLRAEFGLFNPPDAGKPVFVPTDHVPFLPDQAYGWVVTLRTTHERVHWREAFTLPAAPPS